MSAEPLRDRSPEALLAQMTLEEKLAQIVGLWMGAGAEGEVVAPMQDAMLGDAPPFEEFAANGLGHITRMFGTHPVEPGAGMRALREAQRWLATKTRLGIPAIAHEECLTGLSAWQAATYPTPLAWGATFDPELVRTMGAAIGDSMSRLGVHQGLAPVLDVVRDARWGRVEECIGEDPYLVGALGTAYVVGLQERGVIATLKHFVGYSASRGGRNLAPVHAGPRELNDVLLVPFEMALLDGGARSVMHSYAEIDGVPVAVDPALLHRPAARHVGLRRDARRRLLRGGVPAQPARCGERPRRRCRAGAGRGHRHRAARPATPSSARSPRRSQPDGCRSSWWTGRCCGCSGRRTSSGC